MTIAVDWDVKNQTKQKKTVAYKIKILLTTITQIETGILKYFDLSPLEEFPNLPSACKC